MRLPFLVLLALPLLLGGCASGKSSVLPVGSVSFSSPQAALAVISPMSSAAAIYQATAKVAVVSPQGKMTFRLAVIMQQPDRLRLEFIPVLGPPNFFLTTKDGRFQVFLPGSQEFIVGNASPANLSRFLPLAWPAERWISVLLGSRPEMKSKTEELRGNMEGDLYRVDGLADNSGRESLWINPKNQHLERIEEIDPEGFRTAIHFSAFRKIEGRDIPDDIMIDTGQGTTIHITYEDLKIQNEAKEGVFELSPPPGTTIKTLPET